MNKVVLIGRLTKDAELRYTGQGTAVASFTIAINRKFKSKNGETETDFIPIVAWGNQGENTAKYTGKGSQVAVYGRIQVRNYQANDGTKRYVTEVIAEEVTFLGSNKKDNNHPNNDKGNQDFGVPLDDFHPMEEDDDDLPF
ncbi:single-stranded DNA-binding protein [Alkalibaculum sp. M08DMB]|uniref:Single-stranded DNA-binding protein n=1 Tax=Alkalibaculum sporogenes TaxID=2655001 RepID=A0A6A7K725_9FIRM|nr:single-stranded DNA-binding protein [Alkalibaculum sporogenes]MPW25299.1 single-stranded DNA-binding protein [Alkalibaculum sporogenes]